MLRGSKGPIVQVDRLIFDPRYKRIPSPVVPRRSSSLNKTNQVEINQESHIYIPSDKIQIIRLTLEDLNQVKNKSLTQKHEDIISPIYESIDGRRDSLDLIKQHTRLETLC